MEKASDIRVKVENTDFSTIVDMGNAEHREYVMAYPPIPKCIVKEEPASEEDGYECELVAYSPLPHGDIKEEPEDGNDRGGFSLEVQQVNQQEGRENLVNKAAHDASIIVPFVCTPASAGKENDTGELRANKQKRTNEGLRPCETLPSSGQILIKEELEWEDCHEEIRSKIPVAVFDEAPTSAENTGFLQIVPGSVVSLVHQSTPETMEIDVTQIKMEKTNLELDMIQDGHGDYLIAYYPLPKDVLKEELPSEDEKNGCDSDGQLLQLEENFDSAPVTTSTLIASSATTDHENEPDRRLERPRTSKRKRIAAKDDTIEPLLRSTKRKRTQKGHQSAESLLRSSDQVHRNHSKGRSTLLMVDMGEGTSSGTLKKAEEAARCVVAEERSEHSSLDGMDSSDGESTADDVIPNHPTAGLSKVKQKSIGNSLAKIGHPEENKEKPFKCKKCGSSFKLEKYLKKHLVYVCGIGPKLSCKECGNVYKGKQDLQRHLMAIHNVEKSQLVSFGAGPKFRPVLPFKCDRCGKSYKQKSSLVLHLKNECDVDPPFPCTQCNYRSSRKSDLRNHLIGVHNVDRSQFTAYGAAAPHVRAVQAFKCELCGQTYKTKQNLAKHLTYECGVNPLFSCSECDYKSKQKCSLKRHAVLIHGESPSQPK